MVILSNLYKSDNSESQKSLKLIFICIGGLWSKLVRCVTFLGSDSPDILALFEVNGSINSSNFAKEGIFFGWAYFYKTRNFHLCFSTGFTSFVVLLLFPQLVSVFVFVHSFLCYFI